MTFIESKKTLKGKTFVEALRKFVYKMFFSHPHVLFLPLAPAIKNAKVAPQPYHFLTQKVSLVSLFYECLNLRFFSHLNKFKYMM